ncbi:MAG: thioredoxin family protein [Lentimicrobiaceae bacterium]|nr:thioredoxin family protein [Lentimicrobiaceae bacterium]MCB9023337.1 thioredoxin family protein [Lentimicrobiaceae bacterium]
MKTELNSQSALDQLNSSTPALLLYFYNDSCAPCVALRPKVEQMLLSEFPQMAHSYVNSAQFPELSASNGVFASPTIVVFFDGKETFRVSKYISIDELAGRIRRYYNLIFS